MTEQTACLVIKCQQVSFKLHMKNCSQNTRETDLWCTSSKPDSIWYKFM